MNLVIIIVKATPEQSCIKFYTKILGFVFVLGGQRPILNEAQINTNAPHLIQGIKSSQAKPKVDFLISTFEYNNLRSWTELGVGVITLKVHYHAPYRRSSPLVKDSSPPTLSIYGSSTK